MKPEKIVRQGIKPREKKRIYRLDNYLKKESTAKSFKSILQVKKMIAKNLSPDLVFSRDDLIKLFETLQEDYNRFNKVGIGLEKSWRGKSGIIDVIKQPNKVIVQRMKKSDKGEDAESVYIEISKEEINACLIVLGKLNISDQINSKQIFMSMSRILNLGHSSWDKGEKPFETDRILHNRYTTLLCFLENEGLIKYSRKGKVHLINNKISIQEILN
jgi:hypothetical protein